MSSPNRREIRGKPHQVVVCHVKGRYPDGRIKDLIVIHDDMSVDVSSGGEEFITAWVPQTVLGRRN